MPTGVPSSVKRIAFSPDGHTIAVGSRSMICSCGTPTPALSSGQFGSGPGSNCVLVAFSPDGHRIATGRNDGALQLWDADTGAQLGQTLDRARRRGIGYGVQPRRPPDRHDRQRRDASTVERHCWPADEGPDPDIVQVAFSPDGHRVAASGDTAVQQWDVDSGQPLPPMTISGTGQKSNSVTSTAAGSSPPHLTARCRCGTQTPGSRSASRFTSMSSGTPNSRSAATGARWPRRSQTHQVAAVGCRDRSGAGPNHDR